MNSQLTLLIPYRRRPLAMDSFCHWLQWAKQQKTKICPSLEIILLESDATPSLEIQSKALANGIEYLFFESQGIFPKTYLLNQGLKLVKTEKLMAYDVDLIPYQKSLVKHWQLSHNSDFLVTGYRLMLKEDFLINFTQIDESISIAQIAPEDQTTALKKHLTSCEKFGVLPIFETKRLRQIGGWDENFVGWGGEDQDLIERYCSDTYTLCRVPELLYLHLAHDYKEDWFSPEIITNNRRYYYNKKQNES